MEELNFPQKTKKGDKYSPIVKARLYASRIPILKENSKLYGFKPRTCDICLTRKERTFRVSQSWVCGDCDKSPHWGIDLKTKKLIIR